MSHELKVSIGQHSDKGRKETNQDFHGALIPKEPLLSSKGIAILLADGISGSDVSHIAAESTVKSFLTDYYCTPDTWSTKTSAHRVLAATNSWLHAETKRSRDPYDREKGYVCTVCAIVIRSTTAHIFHAGDSRVYRVSGNTLEPLTNDHCLVISSEQKYLSRALGIDQQVEIDYVAAPVHPGDVFVLTTDGVHEHVAPRVMFQAIRDNAVDLDRAAQIIVDEAFAQGSPDNLTAQIVRIDDVPNSDASEMSGRALDLPLPPLLEPRMVFDGYRVIRELHASSRSHIYLAVDEDGGGLTVLKVPSIDLRGDINYLRRFMMEEWIARRVNSAHVLKSHAPSRKRNYLYIASEFVEGRTLRQWMTDNPKPDLEAVRAIVEQIGKGLQAFHRLEMLHQDIRPENIMIDATGTAKIIDFGSCRIAGVAEVMPVAMRYEMLGTVQYSAPEYFLQEPASARSDVFSLGVLTYEMLTGDLPFGAAAVRAWTKSQQRKLRYVSALDYERDLPAWIDEVMRRAVQPDPYKRQEAVSEFIHDLRHPSEKYLGSRRTPLAERNPLLFWKSVSFVLLMIVLVLLIGRYGLPVR